MVKVEDKQVRHYAKYASTLCNYDKEKVLKNLLDYMATKKHFPYKGGDNE